MCAVEQLRLLELLCWPRGTGPQLVCDDAACRMGARARALPRVDGRGSGVGCCGGRAGEQQQQASKASGADSGRYGGLGGAIVCVQKEKDDATSVACTEAVERRKGRGSCWQVGGAALKQCGGVVVVVVVALACWCWCLSLPARLSAAAAAAVLALSWSSGHLPSPNTMSCDWTVSSPSRAACTLCNGMACTRASPNPLPGPECPPQCATRIVTCARSSRIHNPHRKVHYTMYIWTVHNRTG